MDLLVTIPWLQQHLGEDDLVVLDATLPPVGGTSPVDTQAEYRKTHIPGAVFFDIEALSDHETQLPHMLPLPDRFAQEMGSLGIAHDSRIVVYEQQGVFSAPRAWWMLKTFGAQHVSLLEGDLHAWRAAGGAVQSGAVTPRPARFLPKFQQENVKSFAQLQETLQVRGQVIDARSAGRFVGTTPEPRPGLRSGHMPGATSLPYTELLQDGRFKDPASLRRIFDQKGIDLRVPLTTTCGSGVTAAAVALAAELCGARQVSLYDGSWAEYAQRPEAIIETGP